jgi:hypothetical protein
MLYPSRALVSSVCAFVFCAPHIPPVLESGGRSTRLSVCVCVCVCVCLVFALQYLESELAKHQKAELEKKEDGDRVLKRLQKKLREEELRVLRGEEGLGATIGFVWGFSLPPNLWSFFFSCFSTWT